jgi:hypothetical protein
MRNVRRQEELFGKRPAGWTARYYPPFWPTMAGYTVATFAVALTGGFLWIVGTVFVRELYL